MKLDALDHPKTHDFASRLGISRPTAIGHLELLWAWTGRYAEQGNIGKLHDGSIARGADWMGPPEEFILALQEAGFVDADQTHRLLIHNWEEHAPRWVKSKLKTLGMAFLGPASPYIERAASADASPDTSLDSKGREGKCSEEKGRESEVAPTAPPRPRACRIPEDFRLTEPRRQAAAAEGLDPERTFAKFTNYWQAASGSRARKHDWEATWRNWCLTETDRGGRAKPAGPRAKTLAELEAEEASCASN